jgi:hypothetical protein
MIPELCSPISVRPRSRMVRCLKVRIRCLQCHAPPPGTQSTCAKWMPGSADDSTSTMSFSHADECLQCLQYGERCSVHLRCRVSSSTLAARIERAHQKLFETVCSKSLPQPRIPDSRWRCCRDQRDRTQVKKGESRMRMLSAYTFMT